MYKPETGKWNLTAVQQKELEKQQETWKKKLEEA